MNEMWFQNCWKHTIENVYEMSKNLQRVARHDSDSEMVMPRCEYKVNATLIRDS